jgi:hypothetical protein
MKAILRDRHGNRIGERETDANGRVTMRDWNGNRVGTYCPRENLTRDRHGNRVGQGDLLNRLLP